MTVGGDYLQDPPNPTSAGGRGGTMTMGGRGGPRTWNIYICKLIYTCMDIYIYVYKYVCVYTCAYVYIHICVRVCVCGTSEQK